MMREPRTEPWALQDWRSNVIAGDKNRRRVVTEPEIKTFLKEGNN